MEKNKTEHAGVTLGIGEAIKRGVEKRKGDKLTLMYDGAVVLTAFLFSRCHIALGSYPLALAFLAVLPRGVWIALLGAVVGSVSLGGIGVINAVISVVVVLLRIMISGGERRGGALFSEPLVLRTAASTIGAFIGAIYELLLGGFTVGTLLYGCFAVVSCAVFTVALAGIFYTDVSLRDIITSSESIFEKDDDRGRARMLAFSGSVLLYIFLISLSLKSYNFFGISPAYVFSALATLLVSRRFGAVRGMAVGFVSSLGISPSYSVAFALAGLASGIVMELGAVYGLIAGGVLLSAWSAYVGGALGFLTTFPEYTLAAIVAMPMLRRLTPVEENEGGTAAAPRAAEDMVSAVALAYRGSEVSCSAVEGALSGCARALHKVSEREAALSLEEYRNLVIECEHSFCSACPSFESCIAETPAPCLENADVIATKLYKKERLFPTDPSIVPRYCHAADELFLAIGERVAIAERERERNRRLGAVADEYELISRLITEAHHSHERESAQDTALTEKLREVTSRVGLRGGAVRVLGERRLHFIVAGEDKDGSVITSPELRAGIEEAAGVKLGTPEYYRRGDVALLECSAAEKYSVEFFAAGSCKAGESTSGDAVASLSSEDGHFLAVISDGMGSGETAHVTSQLASELLAQLLLTSAKRQTVLHVLNHLIKSRSIECSTTVDLFDFDLVTGEAVFYKCGAAPSYVKRGTSIFRIRSETAPVGIARTIDAERIRVEVEAGDVVVMLSDGISSGAEDGAWLLELIARPVVGGVREYAEMILAEAERRTALSDDATVAVAKIVKK